MKLDADVDCGWHCSNANWQGKQFTDHVMTSFTGLDNAFVLDKNVTEIKSKCSILTRFVPRQNLIDIAFEFSTHAVFEGTCQRQMSPDDVGGRS